MKPLHLLAALLLLAGSALPAWSQAPHPGQDKAPDQTQRKYATLVVEVKDEAGKALENVVVHLDHAGGTSERSGNTGESGYVQMVFVPSGSYFVRVRHTGYAPEEKAVQLEADKRTDVVFVLKKVMA
jgi:hypothetical protein